MMRSVEQSLRQLQTEVIDLLYLHAWDHMTPVEEIVRGMDDLVRMGKVHYLAFSDTPSYIIAEANTRAELMGWSRFIGIQLPYSLADRSAERSEIPMANHWDMAVLPWGILQGGLLSGKYTAANTDPKRMNIQELSPRDQKVVTALQKVADEVGKSPSQVAINWVRQQQAKAQIIPIIGVRTMAQMTDNLSALGWQLTDAQLAELSEAGAIDYGFPRDFVEGGARQFIFGRTFEMIDNHRGSPIK
jgi:aryl-alcohol dehydrogenase-like predicted oxidoreductase